MRAMIVSIIIDIFQSIDENTINTTNMCCLNEWMNGNTETQSKQFKWLKNKDFFIQI